jgi:hypothetical protein
MVHQTVSRNSTPCGWGGFGPTLKEVDRFRITTYIILFVSQYHSVEVRSENVAAASETLRIFFLVLYRNIP